MAYSRFVKWSPADSELDHLELVWRALAGGAAGTVATVAAFPMDTVRARLTLAGPLNPKTSHSDDDFIWGGSISGHSCKCVVFSI